MNNKYLAIALVAAGLISSSANAQESPWLIRARVVNIETANKSDPIAGTSIGKDQIHVSDKAIPELDITYFFTPHWAAELILTYPQEHNVTVAGSKFGTFKHLPPVLTAQYHFSPESKISPYIGAGINYTRIFSVNLNGGTQLDQSSIGGALQAGVDYKIDKNWSLNLDVKKVQIRSDVKNAAGTKISEVRLDPWLIGAGVGYRF